MFQRRSSEPAGTAASCMIRRATFCRRQRGREALNPKATILIVDDEPELREVLEEYFVAQGYTSLSAESAITARALAAKHAVDVALLDVAMPGEDGLSLARHLRERYANLAIIMLTSAGTVIDRIIGLEIGA